MLYILAALQKEADALIAQAADVGCREVFGKKIYTGKFGEPFALVLTGVGKSNAAAGAMLALAEGADRLLNIGTAGALSPDLPVGSVVQIEKAVQSDVDLRAINGTCIGTLNEYDTPYFPLRCGGNFPRGVLASADTFAAGGTDAERALGATVRDMEGAAIAHIAFAAGVPCYAFKSISDSAQKDSAREYAENERIALDALRKNMRAIFAEVRE